MKKIQVLILTKCSEIRSENLNDAIAFAENLKTKVFNKVKNNSKTKWFSDYGVEVNVSFVDPSQLKSSEFYSVLIFVFGAPEWKATEIKERVNAWVLNTLNREDIKEAYLNLMEKSVKHDFSVSFDVSVYTPKIKNQSVDETERFLLFFETSLKEFIEEKAGLVSDRVLIEKTKVRIIPSGQETIVYEVLTEASDELDNNIKEQIEKQFSNYILNQLKEKIEKIEKTWQEMWPEFNK